MRVCNSNFGFLGLEFLESSVPEHMEPLNYELVIRECGVRPSRFDYALGFSLEVILIGLPNQFSKSVYSHSSSSRPKIDVDKRATQKITTTTQCFAVQLLSKFWLCFSKKERK